MILNKLDRNLNLPAIPTVGKPVGRGVGKREQRTGFRKHY